MSERGGHKAAAEAGRHVKKTVKRRGPHLWVVEVAQCHRRCQAAEGPQREVLQTHVRAIEDLDVADEAATGALRGHDVVQVRLQLIHDNAVPIVLLVIDHGEPRRYVEPAEKKVTHDVTVERYPEIRHEPHDSLVLEHVLELEASPALTHPLAHGICPRGGAPDGRVLHSLMWS